MCKAEFMLGKNLLKIRKIKEPLINLSNEQWPISVILNAYIIKLNVIDYFRKDDTVVSGNTFLPPGQAERNETTWSRVDVEKEVRVVDQFL